MTIQTIAIDLIRQYRHEILEERDWFYNLDDYTLNVCDYDGQGTFGVIAYHVKDNVTDWEHYTALNPMTEKDIQLL